MIQQISNAWYRKAVFDVDLVDGAAITHIRQEPSFLGVKRVGTAQGLKRVEYNPYLEVLRFDRAESYIPSGSSYNVGD